MRNHNKILKMVLAALFLALAYVMPFLTGQIAEIGSMLCPMHIPVLLCGYICGWPWGLAVGFVAPLFRSLTLGMPPVFPTAVCMAFELAAYGFVIGLLYIIIKKKGIVSLYISLVSAMLAGRAVWGIVMAILMGIGKSSFPMSAFVAGAFLNAIPGIIIQLVLIPAIMLVLERTGALRFGSK